MLTPDASSIGSQTGEEKSIREEYARLEASVGDDNRRAYVPGVDSTFVSSLPGK
jgi:hypothetical protein